LVDRYLLSDRGDISLGQLIIWPVDGYIYLSGSLPLLVYRWTLTSFKRFILM